MCHAEEHTQAQSKKEQKALCPNFSGFLIFFIKENSRWQNKATKVSYSLGAG